MRQWLWGKSSDLANSKPIHTASINEAVTNGNLSNVRDWLNYDSTLINFRSDVDGRTPLECAVSKENISMIRFLIDKGATIDKKFYDQNKFSDQVKKALLQAKFSKVGSPPNRMNSSGETVESIDISYEIEFDDNGDNIPIIDAWLEHDPNLVNRKYGYNNNYNNIMDQAIIENKPKVVKFLLDKGIPISEKPLQKLINPGLQGIDQIVETMQILLAKGCGNDKIENTDLVYYLIQIYTHTNNTNVLKILSLIKDYPILWEDLGSDGNAIPLFYRLANYVPGALNRLVTSQSLIPWNMIDRNGETVMHVLARDPYREYDLKALFIVKANPTIRSGVSNFTPYQIAKTCNNHHLAQMIESYTNHKYKGVVAEADTIEAQKRELDLIKVKDEEFRREAITVQELQLRVTEQNKLLKALSQRVNELEKEMNSLKNKSPVLDHARNDRNVNSQQIEKLVDSHISTLKSFPYQARTMLFKVAVPSIKNDDELLKVIEMNMFGLTISDQQKINLLNDLKDINNLANQTNEQLKIDETTRYNQSEIASIIFKTADSILEKETTVRRSI